jgi:peptide/nickel transport system permease protein
MTEATVVETSAPSATSWRSGQVGGAARRVLVRLAASVGTLLLVSALIFWATSVLPGDVVTAVLGHRAGASAVSALRDQLHLDDPIPVRYWAWLSGIVTGDFGTSFAMKAPVLDVVVPRLVSTTLLVVIAMVITVPTAVVLGALAAVRPRGLLDSVVNVGSVALGAVPDFVIGLLLAIVFATSVLHLVPAVSLAAPGWDVLAQPAGLVLPVATLCLAMLPYLVRIARSAVLEALQSEYVTVARFRGIAERRVLAGHALRNALVPIVQATALVFGISLGGTTVIEFIFQYPGLGAGLVSAVGSRDVPVVQAIALLFATGWVLANLAADLLAIVVSPRLRAGGRA